MCGSKPRRIAQSVPPTAPPRWGLLPPWRHLHHARTVHRATAEPRKGYPAREGRLKLVAKGTDARQAIDIVIPFDVFAIVHNRLWYHEPSVAGIQSSGYFSTSVCLVLLRGTNDVMYLAQVSLPAILV